MFRGLVVPNDVVSRGGARSAGYVLLSALLFTAWHPLNALTVNLDARALFLDPPFLVIVFLLGLVCAHAYVQSRSLWAPILVHFATVAVWVVLLGGRNLLLGL